LALIAKNHVSIWAIDSTNNGIYGWAVPEPTEPKLEGDVA